jgi:hypothetical protein
VTAGFFRKDLKNFFKIKNLLGICIGRWPLILPYYISFFTSPFLYLSLYINISNNFFNIILFILSFAAAVIKRVDENLAEYLFNICFFF